MSLEQILQAITVTAEISGTTLTGLAQATMAEDLACYPTERVIAALNRCRRELGRGRLTLAEVINRIDDGRPGPDEAWAEMCKGEDDTLVWCDEMSEARAICSELIIKGDMVAARMAFKEAYTRLLTAARAERRMAKFTVSLGFDKNRHAPALADALRRGQLSLPVVEQQYGYLLPKVLQLAGWTDHLALAGPDVAGVKKIAEAVSTLSDQRSMPEDVKAPLTREDGHQHLEQLKSMLTGRGRHHG